MTAPAPQPGRALVVVPVVTGLLSGLVVHVLALVALMKAVMSSDLSDPVGAAFLFRVAASGTLGVALACGVAARVCRWRCRGRDIDLARARRVSVLAGCLTGALVVILGAVLALRWPTLPLYLAGVAAGSLAGGLLSGGGRAARRRGLPTAG